MFNEMQLLSKFDEGLSFLLCVFDMYSKCAWVVPLIDKKGITFQKILKESAHEQNKIWLDKGSEFYNRSIKSWLKDNGTEMYSTHNKGRSIVAERFITTLKCISQYT